MRETTQSGATEGHCRGRELVTQREEALLAIAAGEWEAVIDILARVQNDPPFGAADGSITAEMWTALNELVHVRSNYLRQKNLFLRAWMLPAWPRSC